MDLNTIYSEIVAIRLDIKAFHKQVSANETDLAWIKRVVFGGFGVMFTIISGLVIAQLKAH